MSEIADILRIAAGVGLFFLGRMIIIYVKGLWCFTGLPVALGGIWVIGKMLKVW